MSGWTLGHCLDRHEPVRHQEQIAVTFTDDTKGQVNVAVPGVSNCQLGHPSSPVQRVVRMTLSRRRVVVDRRADRPTRRRRDVVGVECVGALRVEKFTFERVAQPAGVTTV